MIDKTAIIHPSAQIAEDAIIGPYVVIGEGVKIGSGTRVISKGQQYACSCYCLDYPLSVKKSSRSVSRVLFFCS